jgi:DNA-directed RNA polymerase subunit RPC12/RpoP
LCCFNTRFDAAKLNHAFLLAGLSPPSPYKKTCLMQVCKKAFSFTHNSLRNVLSVLGLDEQKMENEGFELWVKCLEGDEQAWADMRDYSIQDTAVLRGLYLKLLPWIPNLPSYGAFQGENDICPSCGSSRLTKEGFAHTSTSRYQRLRCTSCGKYSRSTKRSGGTNVTQIAS